MTLYTVRNDENLAIVEEVRSDCAYSARMLVARRHGIPAWKLTANETLVD